MEEPPYVRMMQSGSRLGPFEVFVSYAHVDESMRRALEAHLSPLARTGRIALWHDRRIGAGHDWAAEIDERIESADIILLLVSPDFVASEYCYGIEMTRAVERHRAGAATVIPVILRPCQWDELPFAEIQALPTDARPITLWDNEDEAYLDVANGLRNSLERLSPPEIVKRSERLSPSSLVALRTNFLLRPGRLRPGMFRLVAPDLAYQYESFLVSGVWDGTHLEQVDHVAVMSVVKGHVLDKERAWESAEVAVGLTTARAAFTVLVRSEPGAEDLTVRVRAEGFHPQESTARVLLSPFPHGDFP